MIPVNAIDLSLTATGIARIRDDGDRVDAFTIKSKGAKDATLDDRAARLYDLDGRIRQCLDNAALFVIEQPAYSQTGGAHHDRSGLWWLLVDKLMTSHGGNVAEVSPTTVKKYATGRGNASKDEVLAAVIRRYPTVDVNDNNAADALVLAAMGARYLGHPIDYLPAKNLEAMNAVRWPVTQ